MNAKKRAQRVRFKLRSCANNRLRLSVFKSLKHFSVQAIDDVNGVTKACVSTNSKACELKGASRKEKADWVGKEIARKLLAENISQVYLDRGARAYHGIIKAFAESARMSGLNF